MAKPVSKSPKSAQNRPEPSSKNVVKSTTPHVKNTTKQRSKSKKIRVFFTTLYVKITTPFKNWRSQRVRLHKSFRRSYREDYLRPTETPGLLAHSMSTFGTIKKHWKTFLPLILIMMLLYIVLVGLMSEDFYRTFQTAIEEDTSSLTGQSDTPTGTTEAPSIGNFAKAGLILLSTVTTGGLDSGMDDAGVIFTILLFLILWLVTVFLLRHYSKGSHPRLRDALYNALSPLLSTLVVFIIIFIQAIPIMLVAITYNAARLTGFLNTPFYALVYFIAATLLTLLSVYLFSSSLIALVAVTAPGVYPMAALSAASDLMAGRRSRFVLRLFFLVFVVALIYIIIMLPVILLDLWLKSAWQWLAGVPIVPFMLLATTCFVFIYLSTYIYKYYRYLLDYQEK